MILNYHFFTFPVLHLLQAQVLSGTPSKFYPVRNSKVVFVSPDPHLDVDVHALFPGNLVKTQRLSDNILQLELGLDSNGCLL